MTSCKIEPERTQRTKPNTIKRVGPIHVACALRGTRTEGRRAAAARDAVPHDSSLNSSSKPNNIKEGAPSTRRAH